MKVIQPVLVSIQIKQLEITFGFEDRDAWKENITVENIVTFTTTAIDSSKYIKRTQKCSEKVPRMMYTISSKSSVWLVNAEQVSVE